MRDREPWPAPGSRIPMVRRAVPSCLAAGALVAGLLAGSGCLGPQPCVNAEDCGALARCVAGACMAGDEPVPGGEGPDRGDGAQRVSALAVVPGVRAVRAPAPFHLPVPLDVEALEVDDAAVDDCVVSLLSVDAAQEQPATLSLQCQTLHLGTLEVGLSVRDALQELDVALTLRLVPSDWHDLERTERELVTLDTQALLDGAPVPVGAPVFLAADRLPEGALDQHPRLLTAVGGVVEDVPFQADGAGLWFAHPASARLWVYFAPVGVPAPTLVASPWSDYEGVWHLEAEADASTADGSDDLDGVAVPAPGVVGGAAGFDGSGGLWTALDLSPEEGALSAWVRLGPAGTRPRQVAVAAGSDDAEGAVDPEAVALYTDAEEQVCAWVGAGDGQGGFPQTVTDDPALLSDQDWHHVAVRWDRDAREIVVDGVVRRTTDGTAASPFRHQLLSIGSAVDGAAPWFGAVDEVRLAATALPASWFRVEHASVARVTTDAGRPFVQGLRPDLVAQSATATRVASSLPTLNVVPTLERGVLVAFVASLGPPATGAALESVSLAPLAPAAQDDALSLAALSYEGALDGSALSLTHDGPAPDQVVVATLAFPGGTERGLAGTDLAAAPIVAASPRLSLAAVEPSVEAAWILVAVASRQGVVRCDACGRHVVGPVEGGAGLMLDVYAGEREPTTHTLAPVTAAGDEAAVVVVRVGP